MMTRVSQLWDLIETWGFREDIKDIDANANDVNDANDANDANDVNDANDKEGNDDKGTLFFYKKPVYKKRVLTLFPS